MKKYYLLVLLFILMLFTFVFCLVLRDTSIMKCVDDTQSNLNKLAMFVESYKDDNGKYPTTLNALESKSDKNEDLLRILNISNVKCDYMVASNEFGITATIYSTWWHKSLEVKRKYKGGKYF